MLRDDNEIVRLVKITERKIEGRYSYFSQTLSRAKNVVAPNQ